ncbi:hypothetical protein GCM10023115_24580 [Pontixanthobacter gangjinensis]|uniref:Uncharacterized protein n=1 Tax=Christiangramia aestuarii TaxID=1028746 RepID=A0A7K1LSY7_9FLAO|nr:hypothetical protein [Christiangramia aestuarii]MUP43913.1 hypothetical protein [Christiangramia aestuarii]
MQKIEDFITTLIYDYPLYTGGLILIFGVIGLLYKIYKNESFKMKDYSTSGWKGMINSYVFIILLIVLGASLIISN